MGREPALRELASVTFAISSDDLLLTPLFATLNEPSLIVLISICR